MADTLAKSPLKRGVAFCCPAERRGVLVPLQMLRYDPKLKRLARQLRRQSTLAEVLLWRHLKGRQRCGIDFHRQKPIDEFIVDFFAPKLMLAVEIDGDSHQFKGGEDLERQKKLETLGVHFLRFGDRQVKIGIDHVIQAIDDWIGAWEEHQKNQS